MNFLIRDGHTVYPEECKEWVKLNKKTFERLVNHVRTNANYNDTYKNVLLICRYFERYSLSEFCSLRQDFVRLHNGVNKTPVATFYQNPEIGTKWICYELKFWQLVNLLFSFVALNIGTDYEKKLEKAFQA